MCSSAGGSGRVHLIFGYIFFYLFPVVVVTGKGVMNLRGLELWKFAHDIFNAMPCLYQWIRDQTGTLVPRTMLLPPQTPFFFVT